MVVVLVVDMLVVVVVVNVEWEVGAESFISVARGVKSEADTHIICEALVGKGSDFKAIGDGMSTEC